MPISTKPPSGQVTQNKLFFSNIDFTSIEGGINPHFTCPECQQPFQQNFKPADVQTPTLFDFNQLVVFQCSACSMKLALFVAVHKDADDEHICIQKSNEEGAGGIPVGWWQRYTA